MGQRVFNPIALSALIRQYDLSFANTQNGLEYARALLLR